MTTTTKTNAGRVLPNLAQAAKSLDEVPHAKPTKAPARAAAPRTAPVKLTGTLVGRNVTAEIGADGIMVIRINTAALGVASASGKSAVIATTNGNVGVPGTDCKLGLNFYRPN